MPRSKPRKLVPVGKLAAFADNPEAFRRNLDRVQNQQAAEAGTQAHRDRARPRHIGLRLIKAIIIGFVAVVVLWALAYY